jgi:RNA polymerase sigma-70 factor (ECF subfamily)
MHQQRVDCSDEAGMIWAAQKGNLDSFNCLVLSYQEQIFNQAFRLMGDAESAADATQETFISAFRNLRSYRGGSFRAWLLRIVTNACYDEIRRRQRRPSTSLEPLNDAGEEIESPGWLADTGHSPEEMAERAELSRAIQRCLGNLPLEFRTVVVLVDLQGLDYTEAAQAIGTPVGTVKSRLARARLRMQDCLKAIGELLPALFRQGDEQLR